jgi:hypothetical protein
MKAGNTIAPCGETAIPRGLLEGVVLLDLRDRYE